MGGISVSGDNAKILDVTFDAATLATTSSTGWMVSDCRLTGAATVKGDGMFTNNILNGVSVTVSSGSVGTTIANNRVSNAGASAFIDKGTRTHFHGNTFAGASTNTKVYNFAAATEPITDGWLAVFGSTNISTGQGTFRVYPPFNVQLIDARAAISTLTSSTVEFVFDVNVNGVSIFTSTSRPTISTGTYDSGWTLATNSTPSWRATSTEYITMDVDIAGTGAGLTLQVRGLPLST